MPITWNVDKKVISEFAPFGENIIHPWGVETADSSAFFSLEDGVGYRYSLESFEQKRYEDTLITTLVCKMKEGKWKLECVETVGEELLNRKLTLTCLEESVFMDFVLRFRFLKNFFPRAEIAGNYFDHCDSNIYHQYETKVASLIGDRPLKVVVNSVTHPRCMTPKMYVRDRHDEWIVHARLLPNKWNYEVIKLCNRVVKTRPLPQWISRPLLKSKKIRDSLWYRGEVAPFKRGIMRYINPLAIPLVKLPKGEVLSWDVDVRWN